MKRLTTHEQVSALQKDMDFLRKDAETQFASIRKDMEKFATHTQVKAEFTEDRKEIIQGKNEIIKWTVIPLIICIIEAIISTFIKLLS